MLAEVKKCAESGDIKGLRYIFVDSLDVDPTFEKYREDYEYCKRINGFFDTHRDLSAMIIDQAQWDMHYWEQIKQDLLRNFSEKRFEHMISVAGTVYADKISRLLAERNQNNQAKKAVLNKKTDRVQTEVVPEKTYTVSDEEAENRRVEQKKKELEEHNRKIKAQEQADRERVETAKRANADLKSAQSDSNAPKKAMGIAAVILVVAVIIVVLIIVLQRRNPL